MQKRWYLSGSALLIILVTLLFLGKKLILPQSDYERLIGTWRFVSSTTPLLRGNPVGYLIYTKEGVASVQLMQPTREKFSTNKVTEITPAEAQKLLADYFAYAGHFIVDEKQKIITHHIETHIFPNDIGKDFKRSYEFDGERLYLKVVDGDAQQVITWERVK